MPSTRTHSLRDQRGLVSSAGLPPPYRRHGTTNNNVAKATPTANSQALVAAQSSGQRRSLERKAVTQALVAAQSSGKRRSLKRKPVTNLKKRPAATREARPKCPVVRVVDKFFKMMGRDRRDMAQRDKRLRRQTEERDHRRDHHFRKLIEQQDKQVMILLADRVKRLRAFIEENDRRNVERFQSLKTYIEQLDTQVVQKDKHVVILHRKLARANRMVSKAKTELMLLRAGRNNEVLSPLSDLSERSAKPTEASEGCLYSHGQHIIEAS